MSDNRRITRLHEGYDARRRHPIIHVFSDAGYEMTVPRSFRDRRLKVGAPMDDELRDQIQASARLWESRSSERLAARAEKAAADRPSEGMISAISEGRRERVHIYLDGNYAFSLPEEVVYSEGLSVGMSLSAAAVKRLVERSAIERIGAMIDRRTAVRPRCAGELRRTLVNERKLDADLVEAAISRRLASGGVLSDQAFIDWFARARGVSRGKGFWAIAPELRRLGVDANLVREYQTEFDESGAAEVAAARAARGLDLSDKRDRAKFVNRLRTRGFGYAIAKAHLDSLSITDEDLAEADDEE